MATRHIVLGAGAIGSAIGGRLHQAGRDVVLVARGAHREALAARGLTLADPDAEAVLDVPVAADAAEAAPREGDVVLVATKTQDTAAVLHDLAAAAPADAVTVVCAQNGLENERLALRRFARVVAMTVFLPAEHLEPGVVSLPCAPVSGVLDVGLATGGTDAGVAELAGDLRAAGFASAPLEDAMAHKRAKLRRNLINAIEALSGERASEVLDAAVAEADACFVAAGLAWTLDDEFDDRHLALSPPRRVGGRDHGGSSTTQSLTRGTSVETPYLNGEVVLLGRLHGVPTPVNTRLVALMARAAAEGAAPGALGVAGLQAAVG